MADLPLNYTFGPAPSAPKKFPTGLFPTSPRPQPGLQGLLMDRPPTGPQPGVIGQSQTQEQMGGLSRSRPISAAESTFLRQPQSPLGHAVSFSKELGGGTILTDQVTGFLKSRRDESISFNPEYRQGAGRGIYEIDHIQPLWGGGSNDESNLERLTPREHALKTRIQAIPYTLYREDPEKYPLTQMMTLAMNWKSYKDPGAGLKPITDASGQTVDARYDKIFAEKTLNDWKHGGIPGIKEAITGTAELFKDVPLIGRLFGAIGEENEVTKVMREGAYGKSTAGQFMNSLTSAALGGYIPDSELPADASSVDIIAKKIGGTVGGVMNLIAAGAAIRKGIGAIGALGRIKKVQNISSRLGIGAEASKTGVFQPFYLRYSQGVTEANKAIAAIEKASSVRISPTYSPLIGKLTGKAVSAEAQAIKGSISMPLLNLMGALKSAGTFSIIGQLNKQQGPEFEHRLKRFAHDAAIGAVYGTIPPGMLGYVGMFGSTYVSSALVNGADWGDAFQDAMIMTALHGTMQNMPEVLVRPRSLGNLQGKGTMSSIREYTNKIDEVGYHASHDLFRRINGTRMPEVLPVRGDKTITVTKPDGKKVTMEYEAYVNQQAEMANEKLIRLYKNGESSALNEIGQVETARQHLLKLNMSRSLRAMKDNADFVSITKTMATKAPGISSKMPENLVNSISADPDRWFQYQTGARTSERPVGEVAARTEAQMRPVHPEVPVEMREGIQNIPVAGTALQTNALNSRNLKAVEAAYKNDQPVSIIVVRAPEEAHTLSRITPNLEAPEKYLRVFAQTEGMPTPVEIGSVAGKKMMGVKNENIQKAGYDNTYSIERHQISDMMEKSGLNAMYAEINHIAALDPKMQGKESISLNFTPENVSDSFYLRDNTRKLNLEEKIETLRGFYELRDPKYSGEMLVNELRGVDVLDLPNYVKGDAKALAEIVGHLQFLKQTGQEAKILELFEKNFGHKPTPEELSGLTVENFFKAANAAKGSYSRSPLTKKVKNIQESLASNSETKQRYQAGMKYQRIFNKEEVAPSEKPAPKGAAAVREIKALPKKLAQERARASLTEKTFKPSLELKTEGVEGRTKDIKKAGVKRTLPSIKETKSEADSINAAVEGYENLKNKSTEIDRRIKATESMLENLETFKAESVTTEGKKYKFKNAEERQRFINEAKAELENLIADRAGLDIHLPMVEDVISRIKTREDRPTLNDYQSHALMKKGDWIDVPPSESKLGQYAKKAFRIELLQDKVSGKRINNWPVKVNGRTFNNENAAIQFMDKFEILGDKSPVKIYSLQPGEFNKKAVSRSRGKAIRFGQRAQDAKIFRLEAEIRKSESIPAERQQYAESEVAARDAREAIEGTYASIIEGTVSEKHTKYKDDLAQQVKDGKISEKEELRLLQEKSFNENAKHIEKEIDKMGSPFAQSEYEQALDDLGIEIQHGNKLPDTFESITKKIANERIEPTLAQIEKQSEYLDRQVKSADKKAREEVTENIKAKEGAKKKTSQEALNKLVVERANELRKQYSEELKEVSEMRKMEESRHIKSLDEYKNTVDVAIKDSGKDSPEYGFNLAMSKTLESAYGKDWNKIPTKEVKQKDGTVIVEKNLKSAQAILERVLDPATPEGKRFAEDLSRRPRTNERDAKGFIEYAFWVRYIKKLKYNSQYILEFRDARYPKLSAKEAEGKMVKFDFDDMRVKTKKLMAEDTELQALSKEIKENVSKFTEFDIGKHVKESTEEKAPSGEFGEDVIGAQIWEQMSKDMQRKGGKEGGLKELETGEQAGGEGEGYGVSVFDVSRLPLDTNSDVVLRGLANMSEIKNPKLAAAMQAFDLVKRIRNEVGLGKISTIDQWNVLAELSGQKKISDTPIKAAIKKGAPKPKDVAKAAGVKYEGLQETGKDSEPLVLFTDPKTGSTLGVEQSKFNLKEITTRLEKSRKDFGVSKTNEIKSDGTAPVQPKLDLNQKLSEQVKGKVIPGELVKEMKAIDYLNIPISPTEAKRQRGLAINRKLKALGITPEQAKAALRASLKNGPPTVK